MFSLKEEEEEEPLNFGILFIDSSKDYILTLGTLSKSMLLRK